MLLTICDNYLMFLIYTVHIYCTIHLQRGKDNSLSKPNLSLQYLSNFSLDYEYCEDI